MPSEQPAKNNRMKIADLCKTSGLKKATIHSYLKMGLLPPPLKVGVNLHLYGETHVEALSQIRTLREVNRMSLTQIGDLLKDGEYLLPQSEMGSDDSFILDVADAHLHPSSYRQDEIIEKAIDLFAERGYESVTISDITDSLKMGKGSFYIYFKNKSDLLLECFKRWTSLIIPLELRVQIRDEIDLSLKMEKRWEGFQTQYKNFARILQLLRISTNAEDPTIREGARKAYNEMIQPLRNDIREAMQKGQVREMEPELTACALIGAAEHLAFRITLDTQYSIEEASKIVKDMIGWVLTPPPSDSGKPATLGLSWTVTDLKNVMTELSQLRVNGEEFIHSAIGEAQIKIPLTNVAAITVQEPGTQCLIKVTMRNGHSSSVCIPGDAVISGDTHLGNFTIPFNKTNDIVSISDRVVKPNELI